MRVPLDVDVATRARLLESVKRFAAEALDLDLGDLKAELFLQFCLREVGPVVYNHAVADAQRHLLQRVEELDGDVHLDDGYWRR